MVTGAVALVAWQWPAAPGDMPRGPLLQAAEQRQVLRVGVRSYPRPTLGQEALVAEPDELDSQLAEALGSYLGLKVQLQALPDMPRGPLLQAAEQRQVLRVGVRSYPRPTLGQEALVAEPDELDSQLAEALGAYLGLKVQLQALPDTTGLNDGSVDLVIAGSLKLPVAADRVASLRKLPVQYREGALIGLRNAPRRPIQGQSVCIAIGSPWAQTLTQQGAELRTYVSSIRAAVAFMAGECNLLAEERNSLQALAQAPDWRFYTLLPQTLKASSDVRVYLSRTDKQSRALINAALHDWQARGGQTRAWDVRSNALLVDSLKIGDGLVCH